MDVVNKYEIFKINIHLNLDDLVVHGCTFQCEDTVYQVPMFKCGNNQYRVYFMPTKVGFWYYHIEHELFYKEGTFECVDHKENIHGPVQTLNQHFIYSDGSKYIPIGTTCYSWTNQSEQLQDKTLETLKKSPFNKVRMGIFPKSMPFNENDPEYFPFRKDSLGEWDVFQLDYHFWDNLERRIEALQQLGIEADLILFHPYDRWGFKYLTHEQSLQYLEYVIARFSAYSNIWWSLANEYEMLYIKTMDEWNEYGEKIKQIDPYNHLLSIHNIIRVFPKKDWMTHCSIQSTNIHNVLNWRKEYNLPIVIDEFGYEGNIDFGWGNLSSKEMIHRFWMITCRGGYGTHGETFMEKDDVLWWAKGGDLHGKSIECIRFLKDILYELSVDGEPFYREYFQNPNNKKNDENHKYGFNDIIATLPEYQQKEMVYNEPMILQSDDFVLRYMGNTAQAYVDISMTNSDQYQVEIIDIYQMSREIVETDVRDKVRVKLPEKEGIAVLLRKVMK